MSKIRHALIMAAGRGSRMHPLTENIPKPMAPFQGSTLIANGIEKLRPFVDNVHITVGYKGAVLAEHVIQLKVNSVFNTEGHGNAWWIYNTLLSQLDEPVLVLTADNITELDMDWFNYEYIKLGSPACTVVPVQPIPGLDGDYIHHNEFKVQELTRTNPSNIYCSGIQIINPKKINLLTNSTDNFNHIWEELIYKNQLFCTPKYPKSWFTVDTVTQLNQLNDQYKK